MTVVPAQYIHNETIENSKLSRLHPSMLCESEIVEGCMREFVYLVK